MSSRVALTRRGRVDGGQAALLVVATTACIAMAAMLGLADLGRATVDATRAQAAADAAALAGLERGRTGSLSITSRHDARLVSWRTGPGPHEVTVVVSVDGVVATARASNAP